MGSYSHSVKSALEQGPINDHNFYTQDEVKYHGSKNRGVHPIEFVSIDEKPPSIRPPPRFQQQNPPQHPSNMNDSSNQQTEVSLSTITRSETTSSVTSATVRPSGSKPTLKPKTESTTKKQLLVKSKSTSVPQSEPGPKMKTQETDYLYFDNGSISPMLSRSDYCICLLLLLLYCSL
ncbi:unnamed protein product [Onchocerca flexuosa]|uniref:Uncharacterized protein n=1 Tax=Onchocerca flexuosa TaxID=387005 RepID=A0A183HWE2_9BILA|nr:unnamed protein product [Onchocerca flexuosa]